MTDQELILKTKNLISQERALTLQVLHHLREIERRQIFAKRGFPSLFEFAVQEFGFTESQAYKRIAAMRLLKDFPELEGKISLSHAAKFQQFFKKQKLEQNKKLELIQKLSSKSLKECEKELRVMAPNALPRQRIVSVDDKFTSLNFVVDENFMKKLKKFKEIYSHQLKDEGLANVFETMMDIAIKKKENEFKTKKTPKKSVTTARLKRSRFISKNIKVKIIKRADRQCEYQDKITGRRCCSRKLLEFDHKVPYSLGGENSQKNLRLYCNAHNKLMALERFGKSKMERYMSSLK